MSAKPSKLLMVFGTRPEAIKMAPVIKAAAASGNLEARVCVTAQHRELLDQMLELFAIEPHYDLDLMKSDQTLTDVTVGVLTGLRGVFEAWRPDRVIVQGDTTTTMAAAMAAYYAHIPVAHVEAGLRTADIYSPWPEEINRRVGTCIADLHFAPTQWAADNLAREGVAPQSIHVTGNTVIDALRETAAKIETSAHLADELGKRFAAISADRRMILVTGHRRESFGPGFERICHALATIASDDDVELVYAVHLNPNVQEPVRRLLAGRPNVHLVEPLDYLAFVYLMRRAHFILTDSGGIQEEAPWFGKPVLVLRDVSERPEAIEAGTAKLVGSDQGRIVEEARRLLSDPTCYETMSKAHNPYGDGHAAARIVATLEAVHRGH